MSGSDEEKGFKVSDHRRFDSEGEAKTDAEEVKEEWEKEAARVEDAAQEAAGAAAGKEERRPPPPEINFPAFIYSLSTSALVHLGDIPDPLSQEKIVDLPLAKQTIDILGMLKEKTRGNLEEEEARFLENILTDLRMRFVQVSQATKK